MRGVVRERGEPASSSGPVWESVSVSVGEREYESDETVDSCAGEGTEVADLACEQPASCRSDSEPSGLGRSALSGHSLRLCDESNARPWPYRADCVAKPDCSSSARTGSDG